MKQARVEYLLRRCANRHITGRIRKQQKKVLSCNVQLAQNVVYFHADDALVHVLSNAALDEIRFLRHINVSHNNIDKFCLIYFTLIDDNEYTLVFQ